MYSCASHMMRIYQGRTKQPEPHWEKVLLVFASVLDKVLNIQDGGGQLLLQAFLCR